MVGWKVGGAGSFETQSLFAKLLKCYYDSGRITKWEDVRELDIKVMKRVGVGNRSTSAGTAGGAVVQETTSPGSGVAVVAPPASPPSGGGGSSVIGNAVAVCVENDRPWDGVTG